MSEQHSLLSTGRLTADRFFSPDPGQRRVARELYNAIAALPIVSPHGHVDPALLANEHATFGTPADLFIIPDHYVFRMLYSQGVPLEALGIPPSEGAPASLKSTVRRITARSGKPLPNTSTSSAVRPVASGWRTSFTKSSTFGRSSTAQQRRQSTMNWPKSCPSPSTAPARCLSGSRSKSCAPRMGLRIHLHTTSRSKNRGGKASFGQPSVPMGLSIS